MNRGMVRVMAASLGWKVKDIGWIWGPLLSRYHGIAAGCLSLLEGCSDCLCFNDMIPLFH